MLRQLKLRFIIAAAGFMLCIGNSHAQTVKLVVGGNVNANDTVKAAAIKFPNNTVQTSAPGISVGTGSSIINNLGGGNSSAAALSVIASGQNNVINGNADFGIILGGKNNTIENQSLNYSSSIPAPVNPGSHNFISNGEFNTIKPNANHSAIIGGRNNIIATGAVNSVILGGSNITATDPNTVYVPSLSASGDFSVSGKMRMRRILSPDSAISFGDSSIVMIPNQNRIYATPYYPYLGMGIGWASWSLGAKGISIGTYVQTGSAGAWSLTLGSGIGSGPNPFLINNIDHSLMVGFNSDVPTLFVGPGNGTSGSIGSIGIGTKTPNPIYKLDVNGNVGIGNPATPNAQYKLDVNGTINAKKYLVDGQPFASSQWQDSYNSSTGYTNISNTNYGYVGIGTNDPKVSLDVNGGFRVGTTSGYIQMGYNGYNSTLDSYDSKGLLINYNSHRDVTIGAMLSVCKLKVLTISGCDFVFSDNYKKMPWQEKELFYKTHKHLPNIDDASTMEKEGLDVGKNFSGVLQNVEENTLDITELYKLIEKLEIENEKLKKEIAEIKK